MAEAKTTLEKPAEQKIIKYKVQVDCYWNDTLWRREDIAEIPQGVTPPEEYFKKL